MGKTRSKQTTNSGASTAQEILLKSLSTILKEVGITNFIVLFIAFFLILFASKEQKERFINVWILLESERHIYCTIIIVSLVLLMIIGAVYFKAMLRISKAENERIGVEKGLLQEKLLERQLSTSSNETTQKK